MASHHNLFIFCFAIFFIILAVRCEWPTESSSSDVETTTSVYFDDASASATEVDAEVNTEVPDVVFVVTAKPLAPANLTLFRQEEGSDDESSEEENKENKAPNETNEESGGPPDPDPGLEGQGPPPPPGEGLPPPGQGIPIPPNPNEKLVPHPGYPPHNVNVQPQEHISASASAGIKNQNAAAVASEDVAVPSSTVASAAAQSNVYTVSRIPIASGSRNPVTVPQKYKLPSKTTVKSIIAIATTEKPLSFAEEWNLTDIFHIGGQGRADCACGKIPVKVENAERAGINQYPWTVAIVRTGIFGGGRVQCGGVLINDKYVITTSNCMDGTYTDGIQVWLTAHNTFQSDNYLEQDRVLKRDVVEIFMHPNYNRQTHDNDVALLKLSKPVDISVSSYYVPICLPATETNYDGMTAKLASWGASTINSGRIFGSRICNEDVPVISNDVCNRDTRHSGKVTSNMMCAGLLTPSSRESCLGDSGGPLMLPNGGRYSLIGVVSWGFQNRQSYSPIVYSKVSGYSDWILHNTRDADWCGI